MIELLLNINFLFVSVGCGGWVTKVSDLKFQNVATKVEFRWDWDIILADLDGSLTGIKDDVLVSSENFTQNNPDCRSVANVNRGVSCSKSQGSIRLSFNNLKPDAVLSVNVTNSNNAMVSVPLLKKRLTHPLGFMLAFEPNQVYTMELNEASSPTNMSFDGIYYNLAPGQYLIMQHILRKKPDRVTFGNQLTSSESVSKLSPNSSSGSWSWEKRRTNDLKKR